MRIAIGRSVLRRQDLYNVTERVCAALINVSYVPGEYELSSRAFARRNAAKGPGLLRKLQAFG